MSRRLLHGVVRGLFYSYFSLVGGMTAVGLLTMDLVFTGAAYSRSLPDPLVAWLVASAVIAAMLVLGQLERFGKPLNLWKWIPLCLIATFPGLVTVGFAM